MTALPQLKRRIVLVSSRLGGGGAERIVAILANHWATCGHEVIVVLLRRDISAEYPVHQDVRVVRLGLIGERNPPWNPANLVRLAGLRRGLVRLTPDLVISFLEKLNVAVLLSLVGTGVPVIATEHLAPWMNPLGFPWEVLRRRTYRRARSVISPTREISAWLSERMPGRFATIPYPFVSYAERPASARQKVILAVGRLDVQKGFDVLIEAFAQVASRRPEWTLEVAGEGPFRSTLRAQIDRLGLGSRVRLLGQIAEMAERYGGAEVFVLASRHEAYPMALCEAMSAGCPVIATDCPTGPREILGNPPAGLLVPSERPDLLAQALDRLVADTAIRERLRHSALQRSAELKETGGLAGWDRALAEWTS
ncbi:glycosyltransferase family 4 protein [Opitutaceae bacterium EW11]|nr:glycosyltransferase family 4 protein [Opitutaceae bacterium EW11]